MIKMIEKTLDLTTCGQSLDNLEALLKNNREISETGQNGLQEFFTSHPDLILLMGDCFFPGLSPAAYQHEFSIIGEFRADFAVCNQLKSKFLFIEFEDAKKDSVFVTKSNGRTSISYEWSPRFEHGYSQVVDWHYRMDDLKRTFKFSEHFGQTDITYDGLLVIGRNEFLKEANGANRLKWRKEKTIINSARIHCITFDELFEELRGRYNTILSIVSGKLI